MYDKRRDIMKVDKIEIKKTNSITVEVPNNLRYNILYMAYERLNYVRDNPFEYNDRQEWEDECQIICDIIDIFE